jgi:hypothetical protein
MDILSHYYIIDLDGNSLIHSKLDAAYLRGLFDITEVEFNVIDGLVPDLA